MKIQSIMAEAAGMLAAGVSYGRTSAGFSDVMSKASSGNVADTSKDSSGVRQPGITSSKNSVQETRPAEKAQRTETGDRKQQTDVSGRGEISKETKELVENEIRETVQKGLGVSEEELEEAMSVLALGYLDLLNQDNLKTLTMYMNGVSDVSDILMDDDLSMMLTQLMGELTVENIAEDTGVAVQDIKQLLEENDSFLKETLQTVNNRESLQAAGGEDLQVDDRKETSAGPEVIVEKETENTAGNVKEPVQSDGKDSFLENRQGAEKQDLADEIVNNIVSTVKETVSADGTVTMTTVEMRQVVIQVVEQIKVVIRPEQTNMQMTLYPEHLGRLQLMVTSRDGVMTANFTVQNEMVRQALEAQVQELKNTFEEQGLKVEAVEVTVASFEFNQSDQTGNGEEQQGQKKQSGRNLSLEDAFLEEAESDLEEKAAASISGTGTNINYTA